ncbi:MAG TPA: hypothetical protein VGA97_03595, partial [Acidimicrobiia bacterium]
MVEPECNGVIESFMRTLKERCLYLHRWQTLEEVRRDGMVYVFGDNAPLREIRDRFGNRVTVDRVNASLPAYKVTSPHGRWLEFTLTVISGWQLITEARDNLGRVVTYDA